MTRTLILGCIAFYLLFVLGFLLLLARIERHPPADQDRQNGQVYFSYNKPIVTPPADNTKENHDNDGE